MNGFAAARLAFQFEDQLSVSSVLFYRRTTCSLMTHVWVPSQSSFRSADNSQYMFSVSMYKHSFPWPSRMTNTGLKLWFVVANCKIKIASTQLPLIVHLTLVKRRALTWQQHAQIMLPLSRVMLYFSPRPNIFRAMLIFQNRVFNLTCKVLF